MFRLFDVVHLIQLNQAEAPLLRHAAACRPPRTGSPPPCAGRRRRRPRRVASASSVVGHPPRVPCSPFRALVLIERYGGVRSRTSRTGIFAMSAPSRMSAARAPPEAADLVEVRAGVEQRAAIGLARQHGEDRHALARGRLDDGVDGGDDRVVAADPDGLGVAADQRADRLARRADVLSTFASSSVKSIVFASSRAFATNTSEFDSAGFHATPMRLRPGSIWRAMLEGSSRPVETSSGRPCRADASAGPRDRGRRPTGTDRPPA